MPSHYAGDEDILVDFDFEADLRCRNLVIEEGCTLRGKVEAEQVRVHGIFGGTMRATRLDVMPGAACAGDLRVEVAKVQGTCAGLLVASRLLACDGSRIEGRVIADRLGSELGADIDATLCVRDGVTADAGLVDSARRALSVPRPVPLSKIAAVPAAAIPDEGAIAVEEAIGAALAEAFPRAVQTRPSTRPVATPVSARVPPPPPGERMPSLIDT